MEKKESRAMTNNNITSETISVEALAGPPTVHDSNILA